MIRALTTALVASSVTVSALTTVAYIDIPKYLGRWYQVKTDQFNNQFTSGEGFCATADYGLLSNGNISVVNTQNTQSASGPVDRIDGYAYIPNPAEPGKLLVHLNGVPVDGDYWVIELGPMVYGPEKLYDYAIITDRTQATLFVITRDVANYYAKYDAQVMATLKSLGFTKPWNTPLTLSHEGCTYTPVPNRSHKLRGVPETVPELDITSYTGRWYQMYASATVMESFEKDAVCVTADYGINADGTISVHNADNLGSQTGPYDVIDGYAYVVDASKPGQLMVHFDSTGADAPYWVLALGPKAQSGYEWSIVSDPFRSTLFILARDVATFRAVYEDDVLALTKSLGFTAFYNKPIETVQDGCTYSPQP